MTPDAVLAFWFEGCRDTFRDCWFRDKTEAYDAAIRARFAALPELGRSGALDGWTATPMGTLALVIALDQFPRNLHRGSAEAFACDAKAREVARAAIFRDRLDLAVMTPTERVFLYLPFEHHEDAAGQDLSVALYEGGLRDAPNPRFRMPGGAIDYAWRHWQVIRDFGRFPHRNAALGRESTPAERAWLAAGGGF
jgi:uncharacterized protein (DUF924 family)